ncbi:MAG: DHH family phosphoesterase [Bacillota bacterium]|nr:DHH family phosphoesterase [Bacillota bacterium]
MMENKFKYFTPNNKIYMIIIASLTAVLFIYGHNYAGVAAFIICIVLLVYNIENSRRKKGEWKKFIENFSGSLDSATRNTLLKLPFPLIMIDVSGGILWYNQNTSNMILGEDVLGGNIKDVIPALNLADVTKNNVSFIKNVKVMSNIYNINVSIINSNDDNIGENNIILLYFTDVTENSNLKMYIEEDKECILLVEVDNMDEVIKSTDEDKKPLIIAEIEQTINSYAQRLNAMQKKYSQSKYIMVSQNKDILSEMERKFDILDTIREIEKSNMLTVTISIGIGKGGKTPLDNYKLASSAKELALGRGGDQVVIRDGEELFFYGGKSKEFEKRTKVKARVIANALVDLLNNTEKVFIMGHKNMDIDCLGAAIGINSISKLICSESYIILEKYCNAIKIMLDKFENNSDYKDTFISSKECEIIADERSLLIIVDVHNYSYVYDPELIKKFSKIVIIDHHRKSSDYIERATLSYVEPYASSASELVTEMIPYMVENTKIGSLEAEALLAGIILDTKNFSFKTGVRTFEAAGYLRKLGADTIDIRRMFSNDFESYLKKADIIKSAIVKDGIAIAVCPPEIEDNVLAAQAADELLNITAIQVAFVLVKIGDDVVVSGRSLGDINVQVIMESLGGGGHMTMAGTRLKHCGIQDARIKVEEAAEKYITEGDY